MAAPATGLRVRRCGPFLLGRRIGAGGMAAVFAARQQGPRGVGRLVAVKVMSTAIADDPAYQRMFVREVTIATRLEHPNTVRVYEVGDADGEIFLAMEFVHGASLAALMRAGKRPPIAVTLHVMMAVARGLHAAHELRDENGTHLALVHQDVSPQNVMVGYDGGVKLLDFGVARIGAVDASRTETIRGKPAYLAPEQVKGERVDRRTDVFALGIVAHELLCGRRLFDGETALHKYAAVVDSEIPDVRDVAPDVPVGVAAVVARALRRAPDERFTSAEEMRRALADARAAAGVEEVDETTVGRWVEDTAARTFTAAELEREIVDGTPAAAARVQDVSDIPTVAAGPLPVPAASAAVASPPSRRPWWIAAAVAVLGVAAAVVSLARPNADAPQGAASPASASAPVVATAEGAPSADVAAAVPPAAPDPAERADAVARSPVAPTARAAPSAGARASAVPPAPAAVSSAPVAAAPARGFLSVGSNVSGRVTVDGAVVGDSPISKLPVAPGSHTVSVSTEAGVQRQTVTVAPDDTTKVKFVF